MTSSFTKTNSAAATTLKFITKPELVPENETIKMQKQYFKCEFLVNQSDELIFAL